MQVYIVKLRNIINIYPKICLISKPCLKLSKATYLSTHSKTFQRCCKNSFPNERAGYWQKLTLLNLPIFLQHHYFFYNASSRLTSGSASNTGSTAGSSAATGAGSSSSPQVLSPTIPSATKSFAS